MNIRKISLIATLAILLTSCCPCKKLSSVTPPIKDITWTLVSLNGQPYNQKEKFTIVFGQDNRVSGVGDCNRFSGEYELGSVGKISITPLVSTRMFCERQSEETNYFAALEKINGYSVDIYKNILILLQDSQAVAIFESVSDLN